jgi:beta-lactam-binding protein with PASTA domain
MTSDVLPARPPQRPKVSGTLLAGIAIVAVLLVVLGVFVFRGGGSAEAVAVPDVVGASQAQAVRKLQAARLSPVVTVVAMDSAPVGTVLSTTPVAGAKVPLGTGSR